MIRTQAPSFASPSAMARPIPMAAPVTIATCPSSVATCFLPFPATELLIDVPVVQVLDFNPLVDSVLRSFATDSGLLDTAERRHFGGDDRSVDAHNAVVETLRHPPGP